MRDDYLYSDLDFRADFSSGQQIYGLTMTPSPSDSLSFSSSTGSTITKHCYDDLNNFAGDQKLLPRYDEICRSISREFGVEGANIVLGSSGTHLEVLSNLFGAEHEKVLNIMSISAETGSGSPFAADLRFQRDKKNKFVESDRTILIDNEQDLKTTLASHDCKKIVRVVIGSKFGRVFPSIDLIKELVECDNVIIIYDLCQARVSRELIRKLYTEQSGIINITGSKFFAGPIFSGAMLIPDRFIAEIENTFCSERVLAGVRERLPAGLMPDAIKRKVFPGETSFGDGLPILLRWYCAMQNISAYFKIPVKDRLEIISSLVSAIEKSLDTYDLGRKQPWSSDTVAAFDDETKSLLKTIISFRPQGISPADLYQQLRQTNLSVGQPATYLPENEVYLRLSISALDVIEASKFGIDACFHKIDKACETLRNISDRC